VKPLAWAATEEGSDMSGGCAAPSVVGAAEAVAAVPRRHAAHAASILRKPLRRAGIGESLR